MTSNAACNASNAHEKHAGTATLSKLIHRIAILHIGVDLIFVICSRPSIIWFRL